MHTGYVRQSARVILVDGERRVLLFHAYKDVRDHSRGLIWFTPGGGIEEGEDLAVAAARELFEETGLQVTPGTLRSLVAFSEGHANFPGWLEGVMRDNYFFLQV